MGDMYSELGACLCVMSLCTCIWVCVCNMSVCAEGSMRGMVTAQSGSVIKSSHSPSRQKYVAPYVTNRQCDVASYVTSSDRLKHT